MFTFFLHIVLSERPIFRYCPREQWAVNNLVISLHCFLFKASRSLDSFSKGPSTKSFICQEGESHSQITKKEPSTTFFMPVDMLEQWLD
jgi:hypothetical protein